MFIQLLVSGLLLGGIYALLSLGLSLMLGVSNFTNFAHGDFVMVGMYLAFCCFQWFGLNPYFSWPIVAVMSIVIGAIIFFVGRRTIGADAGIRQILFTLGLSMVLQNRCCSSRQTTSRFPALLQTVLELGTSIFRRAC